MIEYRVTWECDIDAESPEQAAQIARRYIVDPDSLSHVFDVLAPDGNVSRIDLDDDPEPHEVH